MKKIIYKQFEFTHKFGENKLLDHFNEIGKDGWKIVGYGKVQNVSGCSNITIGITAWKEENFEDRCSHNWKETERLYGNAVIGCCYTTAPLIILQKCTKCGLLNKLDMGTVKI